MFSLILAAVVCGQDPWWGPIRKESPKTVGDIQVSMVDIKEGGFWVDYPRRVGPPMWLQGIGFRVRITNKNLEKIHTYRSFRDGATLKDNFGNNYRPLCKHGYSPIAAFNYSDDTAYQECDLYPGDTIDVLLFQTPLPNATSFTLTLPLKNLDQPGEMVVTITKTGARAVSNRPRRPPTPKDKLIEIK